MASARRPGINRLNRVNRPNTASAPNDTLGGGFEVPMMCGVLIASDSKSSARDQS